MRRFKRFGWTNIILIALAIVVAGVLILRTATAPTPTANVASSPLPVTNPIIEENKKPGIDSWKSPNFDKYVQDRIEESKKKKAWKKSYSDQGGSPRRPALQWTDNQNVRGYTDKPSVNIGETINFHISSKVSSYDLVVHRMGWYGGIGSTALVFVNNLPGTNRTNPTPQAGTGLIQANWPVSYSLSIPTNWTSGFYLLAMMPSNNHNQITYVPFVVRNDSQQADILYQVAMTTYQAYNAWGGKSLYEYNSTGGRAYKVSFERPYDTNDGAGMFFDGDYHMVLWLEMMGYNVTYATSMDLQSNPNLMAGRKVFLSNWHDEYYSMQMFNNLINIRNAGKHVAVFSSNDIYWQIRFESSSITGSPNKVIVCYKDATLDPGQGTLTTVLFKDPPVNKPENQLLGTQFVEAMGFGEYRAWTVVNANHWVYNGTGLTNGAQIDRLIGYEYNSMVDNGLTPPGTVKLAETVIGGPYAGKHNATIYQHSSGAWVFHAGTNYWPYLLNGNWTWTMDTRVRQMTINVLAQMIGSTAPPTNTPVGTPTHTLTPSRTFTPSNTPIPSATFTPSQTYTPSPVPAGTFYRAINLGGPQLVINGNTWEPGNTATNFSKVGTDACNPWVTQVPATSGNFQTMISCFQQHWAHNFVFSLVPNGTYTVSLYMFQDWANPSPPTANIAVEGVAVGSYTFGSAGRWDQVGPYTATISDGTINITLSGEANVSGIEIYRLGAGGSTPTNTPTFTNTAIPSATFTRTNTPTNTPTSVNTATNTPTFTNTAIPSATFTRTNTPTNTPTSVNTATNTPTFTPTATVTPSGTLTFYRAVNYAGSAVVIDGNSWGSTSAANQTSNGSKVCNNTVTLIPSTDSARASMIRCTARSTALSLTMTSVPNGNYAVYLYTFENNNSQTYSINIQSGQATVTNYQSGPAGTWRRIGPYNITVSANRITVTTSGNTAKISGLEVYNRN